MPRDASRQRRWIRYAASAVVAFLIGRCAPVFFQALLPNAEPDFSYAAIAASFAVNLACLAQTLMLLPEPAAPGRWGHLRAWAEACAFALVAHVGLRTASQHAESWRVFLVLIVLTFAQSAVLLAAHALLAVFCKPLEKAPWPARVLGAGWLRAPRTICVLGLSLATCALMWTREPIQRISRSGGNGAVEASYVADGVVKFSPPTAVGAAWYQESDGARATEPGAMRRFDLVHGPLTYGVWIGSYQAVASPEILPRGLGGFYEREAPAPGLALTFLVWALPILILCDVLTLFTIPDSKFQIPD